MKQITVVLLAISIPLLSACVAEYPDDRRVYNNRHVSVHVDDRDDRDYYDNDRWDNRGRGYHCPPGQAKKGNC